MRGAAGLQSAMDRSVGGRGSETRWRLRPAIWVILSARWAGSSMAEQLTLNYSGPTVVGSRVRASGSPSSYRLSFGGVER